MVRCEFAVLRPVSSVRPVIVVIPVLLAVEVEGVAAPFFAFEAALPALLDLLRGPGVPSTGSGQAVDFVVVVAALVEPVVLGVVPRLP